MRLVRWLRVRDPNYAALRRATRTAIAMPALFAIGVEVVGNSLLATFAAFGSFAMLLLVDFTGTRRERLEAVFWLALVGAGFVCLATVVSQYAWLAAVTMTAVAFAVLFAGVVSSVLAASTTALLLAFVLPVATIGPVSTLPDRLAGWGLASLVAMVGVTVLWPAPAQDPLRGPAIECCARLAAWLRTDVAFAVGDADGAAADDAAAQAREAHAALRSRFYAAPNRPTGLGTVARTLVRLVDLLGWTTVILDETPVGRRDQQPDVPLCRVRLATATTLEAAAQLLRRPASDPAVLQDALAQLRVELADMEAAFAVPVGGGSDGSGLANALEPTFRARELVFAVGSVAANVDRVAQAQRRTWRQRLLGQQPDGAGGAVSSAAQRAGAHLEAHSVWLHNSLRGAVGLGLAVLVADLSGVQHSFWVVLGALSVLRSNALSTGQNIARALGGTIAGIVLGGAIVEVIGTDTTVLWILLPICIVGAGLAPTAFSFAAGQAGFTLTLVILFNIVAPVGYAVGLIRVEDIAIGCGVSLVVGILFWPRGAGAALGRALGEAYESGAQYLRSAVVDAGLHGDPRTPRVAHAGAAAADASRRLDDAFREYLAERGGTNASLAEVTTLVTGVIGPRQAADAVVDLWAGTGGRGTDHATAADQLRASADRIVDWYSDFAVALTSRGAVPDPLRAADADCRLITAVRRDLADPANLAPPAAVRMIWTGDHLDAVRRLQHTLVGPARDVIAAARQH